MEINSEIDSYPEGEGALNKYYSDMLDRPDETYEINSEVCGQCWEDGLISILDPRDFSCPECDFEE
ncbi:hypothetical protein [Nostoc commune]|uniref:hypothetical protein n=1 Tax=Nostoc commune TaxID=1178 RepID=UPI0018C743C9|nr:hypothetical protein [Nostoc commune]MBG1263086.1 hypothetical protein [Nostoc commune BAE]